MKCVLASLSETELEVLRSILEQAGVPSMIRHQPLSGLPGGNQFDSELWVENDADVPTARALYADWCAPVPEAVQTWTCPGCGQRLAVQFDSCWSCGAHRPAEAHLPDSCAEARQRATEMSSVMDGILHQPFNPS